MKQQLWKETYDFGAPIGVKWLWLCFCVHLRRQEDLVQNVRRRLEEALMADSLAHIEDVAADAAVDNAEKKTVPLEKEEL